MSFEQYARARLPVLVGIARGICRDRDLAQDVLQEVLLRAHRRWPSIGPMDGRDAYVRRMLVNELISWRRRWGRSVPSPAELLDEVTPDSSERFALREELLAEVRRLPVKQRAVIVLRYFLDLSDDEIAADLGCSRGTVRVHASRALRTLRIRRTGDSAGISDPTIDEEVTG
ncbi:SigE family RNA polymerase sigma factor [Nakamurella sp. YIM 132087]|uniref:SigE family RNA polymerase sigma factor n=2 Tax=Nakamurella alba TaxID=2665158 RepID=A0A7K1FES1_9ACTN|nr:SigE family RNA polymerase sigma factor [Nakamurella alba]